MTELQVKVLDLLKEFDSICRENGIEYYLAAGTALGAVRHQGFIPWDDDADLYLTRDNFAKLLQIRDKLPENRVIVSADLDLSCEYTINRYIDVSTTRLYRYHCASPQPGGVLLDLLVLDPVPKEELQNYVVGLTEYADLLVKATTHAQRCPYKTNHRKYWLRSKWKGREKVLSEISERIFRYEEEASDYYVQRDPTVPHVWKRETFGKPHYVKFEDTELPIAEKIYEQLSIAFNEDWMYVPNHVDREEHIKALNLHLSYNNIFDDYKKHADLPAIAKAYSKRQTKGNILGELNKEQSWECLKFAAEKVKLDYSERIKDNDLQKMLDEGQFQQLDEFFSEYLEIQGYKKMVGGCAVADWLRAQKPFYIDISDGFLYVFLRNLMHTGSLSKVNSILRARELAGPLNENLTEIRQLYNTIQTSISLYWDGEYSAVYAKVLEWIEKYPENVYLARLYMTTRYHVKGLDLQQFHKELDENFSQMDDDPVLLCLAAHLYWQDNKIEEALDLYEQIVMNSNHGLLLFYIKERMEQYTAQNADDSKVIDIMRTAREKLGEELVPDICKEEDMDSDMAGEEGVFPGEVDDIA